MVASVPFALALYAPLNNKHMPGIQLAKDSAKGDNIHSENRKFSIALNIELLCLLWIRLHP
jgi:hypothetical protein